MATMSWLLGLATQRPLDRSTSRGVMGRGGQTGVILREAGGETWMTTDTISSEQFPWRGEQRSGSSWWWWGQGSRIKMAGKQFVH